MANDPIIEELHRIREEYAAFFDYDIDAIFDDLNANQLKIKQKAVKLKPKRISSKEVA